EIKMMEQLHTPEELVQITNAGHIGEGTVLIIISLLLVAGGLGFLQKSWQRYLIPGISLFAGIALFGFLFYDHLHEFGRAWQWIVNDMQQQQHLWMAIILTVVSPLALLGVK